MNKVELYTSANNVYAHEALYVNGNLVQIGNRITLGALKNHTPIGSIKEYWVMNFKPGLPPEGDAFPNTRKEFPFYWKIKENKRDLNNIKKVIDTIK